MGNVCCDASEQEAGLPSAQKQNTFVPEKKIDSPVKRKPTVNDIKKKKTVPEQVIQRQRTEKNKVLDQYQQILAAGIPWTDNDFPPQMSSLYSGSDQNQVNRFSNYEWKRASDIYENPVIFSDGITPQDVCQGEIGDCYFLCTLSAMAEVPERIIERFISREVNSAGAYKVDFYVNGIETPVIVDDWLPTKYGKPAFGSSNEAELWVCILEKAWAKLHGSYELTEGGLPTMAASHLCGVPSYDVEHKDVAEDIDNFWAKLQAADSNNFTIMSASHGQGEEESELGIISGHAYSLISVHIIECDDTEVRLIKMRNPWGSGEWKGDWSDASDLWTDELRDQVDCKEEDDGIFHISVEDYVSQFQSTSFCVEYNLGKYTHSVTEIDLWLEERALRTFELYNDIDCSQQVFSISVQQQGERLQHYRDTERSGMDYKMDPSRFNIILLKGEELIKAYCCSFERFQQSLIMNEGVLEAGTYSLMIEPAFNDTFDEDQDSRKIIVDIYCAQQPELQEGTDQITEDFKSAVVKHAQQTEEKKFYLEGNLGQQAYSVSSLDGLGCWMGYMYYRNDSAYTINQVLNVNNFDGIEVFKHDTEQNDQGETIIKQDLTPNTDDLIILKRTSGSCSYQVGMSISMSM